MFPGDYDNKLEAQIRATQEVNPNFPAEPLRRALQAADTETGHVTEGQVTFSIAVAFTLLNTKNIVQERIAPVLDRATRRRIERGERAPYTFYTLKYRPF